MKGNKKLKLS